jgi:hypothetical protein
VPVVANVNVATRYNASVAYPRIGTAKSLAPYRECRGWKSFAERNKVRAAALSIGAT